jgi:hypothetical protein
MSCIKCVGLNASDSDSITNLVTFWTRLNASPLDSNDCALDLRPSDRRNFQIGDSFHPMTRVPTSPISRLLGHVVKEFRNDLI